MRTRTKAAALAATAAMALAGAVPAIAAPSTDLGVDGDLARSLRALRPLQGWVIALDPGHNGSNATSGDRVSAPVSDGRGGTNACNSTGVTTTSGYAEHEFTFDVAERTATRLEFLGAEVVMTREDDEGVGPCVDVRGRLAVDVDADVLVSLHANGSIDTTVQGYFAILSDPAMSPSQEDPSYELAADLLDSLGEGGFTPSTVVEDGIQLREDIATLNFARRPAVMLELGEMRNATDAAIMQTRDGRQRYADAVAYGILSWTLDREPG